MVDRLVDADVDSALLFNQRTTAKLLDITTQLLQQWRVQPHARRGREVLYYWPEVFAEYLERYYEDASPDDDGGLDLDQQRARHAKEQADKLALENAEARGQLIYTEHMVEIMGRSLTAFRARLLSIPSKLARRVNPKDPNLARDLIDRAITEALAELANFDPGSKPGKQQANGDGTVRHPATTAEADGKPVGRRRKKAKSGK